MVGTFRYGTKREKASRPRASIIVARGGTVRSYDYSPWMAWTLGLTFVCFSFLYVAGTAYLLFQDDFARSRIMRQDDVQQSYEARIAALRSQIERVTSAHLVEVRDLDHRIETVRERQQRVERQQSLLSGLIEKAREAGLSITYGLAPQPISRPRRVSSDIESFNILTRLDERVAAAEERQMLAVRSLNAAAEDESKRLRAALSRLGIEPSGFGRDVSFASGGPFIPADAIGSMPFEALASSTEDAIDAVHHMRASVRRVPVRYPLANATITSHYGRRLDPFLRRPAFHAGLDFQAPTGTPVVATAAGEVVKAARAGGFGRLIEIEHADGLTTRYAHLSAFEVAKGDHVRPGAVIGRVGSSGRSTGPHLHYEVLRRGRSIDPVTFLKSEKL